MIPASERWRGREARCSRFVCYHRLCVPEAPRGNSETRGRLHLPPPRHQPLPAPPRPSYHFHSSAAAAAVAAAALPSHPNPHAPNIFNYIFSQVLRLSNQGADIDACADKSANTGNKINKDFEERVTANFAQWSAPHSRVRFLIERATPENSCSAQKGGRVGLGLVGGKRKELCGICTF